MIDALVDWAVIDREIDKLVDSIELDGWVVERPGQQPARDQAKVIRYRGMKAETAQSQGGRNGADMVPLTLNFVVGTVTALGDLTWVSTHHAGAGTSAVLAALLTAGIDADGHTGGFRKYTIQDVELDPVAFAVERMVMVHGQVQRESGTGMSTVS